VIYGGAAAADLAAREMVRRGFGRPQVYQMVLGPICVTTTEEEKKRDHLAEAALCQLTCGLGFTGKQSVAAHGLVHHVRRRVKRD